MGQNMKRGHEDIAREGEKDFRDLTKGTISTKQLRAMGHPFGRGLTSSASTPAGLMRGNKKAKLNAGRRLVNPLPINRQTGRLQLGIFRRRVQGGIQSFIVGSNAPYEGFILSPSGTKRMVGRGMFQKVKMNWRARNKAFVDVFVRNQRKP